MEVGRRRYIDFLCALAFSGFAYGLLNFIMLRRGVLYKFANKNYVATALNGGTLLLQLMLLLLAFAVLPRRAAVVMSLLIGVSGFANVAYGDIMFAYLDAASMAWLLSEVRQAGNAAREVFPALVLAGFKVAVAMACLWAARRRLVRYVPPFSPRARILVVLGVLVSTLALGKVTDMSRGARGSEFSAIWLAIEVAMETHPERQTVSIAPQQAARVQKIVWLVDESVAAKHFLPMAPSLLKGIPDNYPVRNFGTILSFGNCSAQSNALLRWGVDVGQANTQTDLRVVPSIWNYARAAGFKSTLMDGQIRYVGQPQNMMWSSERVLIDEMISMSSAGVNADREIAAEINRRLKQDGKQFIYAVLRGAHFQYQNNYPVGDLPSGAPLERKYRHALEYSKRDFFPTVLKELAGSDAVIIYTSDHGEVVEAPGLPHCNVKPHPAEYHVPLLVFMPKSISAELGEFVPGQRHHSQLFPTTMWLMGYTREFAEQRFDRLLDQPSKRPLRFGSAIEVRPDRGEGINVSEAPSVDL